MFSEFEARIHYVFKEKSLLENALTHSSYANENRESGKLDNERLEFLGDSILGFVVAEHLFHRFPQKPEGELTRMRAELVCEKNLAKAARSIDLGSALLLGHGESINGGADRDSILSDAMESVFAAVYLDGGFAAAKNLIEWLILGMMETQKPKIEDFKTAFQELVQQKKNQEIRYVLVSEQGPDHNKEFCVNVLLNGKVVGNGCGRSKKRAEQNAAKKAIETLFGNM